MDETNLVQVTKPEVQEPQRPAARSNNVGLVRISLVQNSHERVLEMLEGCVIFHAEQNMLADCTEYMISHPDLDEISLGTQPPAYNIIIQENEDGTRTRKFERASGRFFMAEHPIFQKKFDDAESRLINLRKYVSNYYLIPIEQKDWWMEFYDNWEPEQDFDPPPFAQPIYNGTLTFKDPQFVKFKD